MNGELPLEAEVTTTDFEWVPPDLPTPHYWGGIDFDPQFPIDSLSISISHSVSFYFGYASELTGSIVFKNLSQDTGELIFDISKLGSIREQLSKFRSLQEIPVPLATVRIRGVSLPVMKSPYMKVVAQRGSARDEEVLHENGSNSSAK